MATMQKELVKARLKVTHEPTISSDNYKIDMIRALNYYNTNHTGADYRSWFHTHFKKQINFPMTVINDFEYRVGGSLARIMANGNELSDEHKVRLERELTRIKALCLAAKAPTVVVDTKPKANIQERMDDKVKDFLGEFAGLVDEFVTTGTNPNVGGLIKTMNIAGPMGKKIIDRIEKPMQELKDVLKGDDKQLVEGWSNFKKADIKKMLGIYDTLIEKLQQAKVTVVKKTRTVKAKPAGVIVQKLKYQKEDVELKLKSVIPASIVGASEVWAYNTKTKKLQSYFAMEGTGITVKGTTLLNFDVAKSKQRTIRKPEAMAAVLNGAGKRVYSQFVKALTTKDSDVNGRFGEDTIILAAFK